MKNTIQKFKYIIFGVLLVIGATAVQAVQISVPSANGSGFFLQSSTTGQYLPVSLTAGSNITIATTSSNVTISASGGSGSFPFSADTNFGQVVYSTSTPTLWFKSGLFASSTSYIDKVIAAAGTVGSPAIQVNGGEGLYQGGVGILSLSNGTSGVSWDGSAFYPNSSNSKNLGITGTNLWNKLFVNYASTTMTSVGSPATSWLLATSSLTSNTLLLTNNGYPSVIVGKDDASTIANFEINSVGQGAYTSFGFKNDTGGTHSGTVGLDEATSLGGISDNVLVHNNTAGGGAGLLIPMTSGNASAILRTYNGLGAIFNVDEPYQAAGTEANVSETMHNSDAGNNTLDLGLEDYPGTTPTGKQMYMHALADSFSTQMPVMSFGFWNQGCGSTSNATCSWGFMTASSTSSSGGAPGAVGTSTVIALGDTWTNGYSKGGGTAGVDYGVQGVRDGTGATVQIVSTTTRSKALEVFKRSGNTYTSLFTVKNDGSVGVGTTSPAANLVVTNSTGANAVSNIQISTPGTGTSQQSTLDLMTLGDASFLGTSANKGWTMYARGNAFSTAAEQNDLGLSYWNGTTYNTALVADSLTGNIGIGSTSPFTKLSVAGTITANNINATSTTATSTFNGNVLISPNNDTTYGFNSWQPFEIVGSSNNPFQMDIVNRSTGAQALSSIFLGNDKTTNGGFTSSYYGGMTCAGSNYNTPGANAVRPNGCASFASDGPYSLGSAATNAASSTIFFQSGSGLDVSYDAALMGGLGNFVLGTTTLRTVNGIASYALSTAYNNAKLWISSSTIPQIALEGGDADNIWNMRSIGNQFFLATSSPTTYATSSRSAFSIDTNGFPAFSALAGVGCAQFDATGKFSNTGSACGSGGGGGGVGWASSTADTNSIYSYGTGGVFVRGNSSAATSSRALLEVNAPGGIMPFYVGSSTSLFEVDGASNGFVSVGSTTPWGKFSVNPNALGSGVPELVVGSSSATRFLINGAGNIGIGTTTPTNPLTIFSSTGGQISLSAGTGVSQAVMRYDGSNFTISSTTVAGTATSTPAAFTLNTTGVGFFSGTTTNSAATGFAINGTGYLSGLSSSASTQTGSLCLSSTNEVINDSGVCIVSDLRAKNVKGLFTDALSEIAKIKPISYFYKPEFNGELQKNPNYSAEQLGLGAQDLQKVDPRLVEVYTKDGKNNVFSYKQGEASAPKIPALVALALGGVKELNQKVENINLGKVTRSAQDNWQWAVIVLLALWIVRLEVKLKKRD